MQFKGFQGVCVPAIAAIVCLGTIGIPTFPSEEPIVEPLFVEIAGSNPQLCLGFTKINGRAGSELHQCPANYAMFWVGDDGGKERPGKTINITSSCCPLPSEDIIEDLHVFVYEECPEDYIATGSKEVPCNDKYCPVLMRCSKINTDRYRLGKSRGSKYWGNGHAGWQDSERVEWEAIPESIKYSVGRKSDSGSYDVDGCVGFPWGSLLTKKTAKFCHGYGFKQLQFSGAEGDPSVGTPVRVYADCSSVANPHDPKNAKCVKSSKKVGV